MAVIHKVTDLRVGSVAVPSVPFYDQTWVFSCRDMATQGREYWACTTQPGKAARGLSVDEWNRHKSAQRVRRMVRYGA